MRVFLHIHPTIMVVCTQIPLHIFISAMKYVMSCLEHEVVLCQDKSISIWKLGFTHLLTSVVLVNNPRQQHVIPLWWAQTIKANKSSLMKTTLIQVDSQSVSLNSASPSLHWNTGSSWTKLVLSFGVSVGVDTFRVNNTCGQESFASDVTASNRLTLNSPTTDWLP